ncbi:MAG: hypothetical protein CMJ19_21180 [Phycisphaeraceae bacterium]|nr:hypothetical protein [Phycisphaeraceae bacterium]
MRECPSCGREVSEQAHTCPHCGQPLRETAGQQLAGCGLLVIAAIGFILAHSFIGSGHLTWIMMGVIIIGGLVAMDERRRG